MSQFQTIIGHRGTFASGQQSRDIFVQDASTTPADKLNRCQVFPSQPNLVFLNNKVSATTYALVLDSCTCPLLGEQVHAHLLKNGFHHREFVQTKLLQMYGKCGCIAEMASVFDKMPERNLYTYAAILNVLLDNGSYGDALFYLEILLSEIVDLEFFIFPVLLKICCGYGGVGLGRQLHGMATKCGVSEHVYVGNSLVDMYGKCGNWSEAVKVFWKIQEKDCVSWNYMVTAFAINGMVFKAVEYLEEMLRHDGLAPNTVTWNALICGLAQNGLDEEAIEMLYRMKAARFAPSARMLAIILPACVRLRKLSLGREIYGYITRHGFMSSSYIVNGLIDLYRRCGDMENALNVFSEFSTRDEVSFNTMIAGYCDNGQIAKAKELFDSMEHHGDLKDVITWNSMITGYADNFMFEEALRLLVELINEAGGVEPNSLTLVSAIGACTEMGYLRLGKEIHSYCITKGLESNAFVGAALVEMYCKFQDLEAAKKVLCKVHERDAVIWNTFISGYARSSDQFINIQSILQQMIDDGFEPNTYTWNGIIAGYVEHDKYDLALCLFSDMQASNLKPDSYTVGIALRACSQLATAERGKQLHAHAIRRGLHWDAYIIAALIDMYAKCGIMEYAKRVFFYNTETHNLITQNAMINAYAMHGHGEDGVALFKKMLIDGITPDSVTFLAVLSACAHTGAVHTGQEIFDSMSSYDVIPTIKHYTSMADLLSRDGKLERAYELVRSMPVDPDSVTWAALLGGCVIHCDAVIGEIAANKLIELEPDNAGNYVMLANLYASTYNWGELRKIRQHMVDEQLHKSPGCSWMEEKDDIHIFIAGDRSHRSAQEIYDALDHLTAEMKPAATCFGLLWDGFGLDTITMIDVHSSKTL